MTDSFGFLYIATGAKYVAEALRSAASFYALMPDVPIALIKDRATPLPDRGPFTSVTFIEQASYTFVDKITPLKNSPFHLTVFLDTDTHCISPCYELFDLLDRFDCAAAHAPVRECWTHSQLKIPASFPELNTGVLAYKNELPFHLLVDDWYRTYQRFTQLTSPPPHDQPAFRDALFRSNVRFYVLPSEYNLRSCFSHFIGGNARPSILHDRGPSLQRAIVDLSPELASRLPRVVEREIT